jgi:hypothetical protein
MEYVQVEVLLKEVEISVVVQQLVAGLNAEGGQETIDCAANGDAESAQYAVVAGRLNGQRSGKGIKDRHGTEKLIGLAKAAVEADSLENLNQHESGKADGRNPLRGAEPKRLRRVPLIQEVNPNRRVNNDHGLT